MMLTSLATAPFLLAETAPATGGLLGNPIVMMVLMVVMFYFLLIRPQQKQRKDLAARIAGLQTSDRVVTSAGIHGTIQNVKEQTVIVKVSEGTTLEFDKSAIATVSKRDNAAK
jgi:preprotein translocase subunit YajC